MKLTLPRTIIPVTGSHRILQERSGKDPRVLKEDTGNHWNQKQYSSRKMVGFFSADSYKFPMLSDRNRSEFIGKIPKISDQNTASEKKRWNYTETAVPRPDYSTWVFISADMLTDDLICMWQLYQQPGSVG